MTSAADFNGTITMAYDGANRLTSETRAYASQFAHVPVDSRGAA
jgi:YD repeat-containing protein